MPYASKFPADMASYFSSKWTPNELWLLNLPVAKIPVVELEWHLDYPFWPTQPPHQIFDLKPRDVLSEPDLYSDHYHRILKADISYPLEVGYFGSTVVILDGIHRLAKMVCDGNAVAQIRYVPESYITRVT